MMRLNTSMTLLHNVFLILIVLIKILFAVYLKHSSFWPSVDAKST